MSDIASKAAFVERVVRHGTHGWRERWEPVLPGQLAALVLIDRDRKTGEPLESQGFRLVSRVEVVG